MKISLACYQSRRAIPVLTGKVLGVEFMKFQWLHKLRAIQNPDSYQIGFEVFYSTIKKKSEDDAKWISVIVTSQGHLIQSHFKMRAIINYYSGREAPSLGFDSCLCMRFARDPEIKMSPRSIPTWPTRHQAESLSMSIVALKT